MADVLRAIEDVKALNAPEEADSLLRMTNEQIRNAFAQYGERQEAKAETERQKLMKENAEASAKWLAEKRWLDQTIMCTPNGAKGELGEAEYAAIARMMEGGQ